jgi:signal transduction histidine kinase/CheY-like chemotaxis protein
VWSSRVVNRRRDGELFTADATISPVKNSRGEVERYVVVYKDITRELELEGRVHLAQTMESIGRLAGGIAHDFNNLLTVINGNAEVALRRAPADEAVSGRLVEILKASERAAEMTGQLLALGRKRQTAPEVLVLNAVIRDLRDVLERLAGEKVDVRWELDPGEGRVQIDPVEARQVLINLVANARDAMPDGGRAVVRTRRVEIPAAPREEFPGAPPGAYVLLEVADAGMGMDAATQQRIFEPFFSTKGPGKGTGLGLATVYGIVQQNGGWVGVRSRPGQGSVFSLLLPEAAAQEKSDGVAAQQEEPARTTVLLVEDQEQVRAYIQKVLESNGYAVTSVEHGEAALETLGARAAGVKLLLTDVVMPGMSGTELARRVLAQYPGIRVLCMSGYAGEGEGIKAWLAEGHTLLRKPFTAETLLARVRESLAQA